MRVLKKCRNLYPQKILNVILQLWQNYRFAKNSYGIPFLEPFINTALGNTYLCFKCCRNTYIRRISLAYIVCQLFASLSNRKAFTWHYLINSQWRRVLMTYYREQRATKPLTYSWSLPRIFQWYYRWKILMIVCKSYRKVELTSMNSLVFAMNVLGLKVYTWDKV